MKAPPHVYFQPKLNLLIWKPRGTLDEKAINKIIAFIADEEAAADASERRFIDTTALTAVDLNFRYVFHVALYRRMARVGRQVIKSAFWINDDEFAHYFQLHAMLTNHSPLKVKLFRELEAAAKWLGVPAEALQLQD